MMSVSTSPSIATDEPSVDDLKADFDEGFAQEERQADYIPATCLCSICCDL